MASHHFSHAIMATTDASYEKEGCLHEMFQRQAKKTPSKTTIVDPMTEKPLAKDEQIQEVCNCAELKLKDIKQQIRELNQLEGIMSNDDDDSSSEEDLIG